MSLLNIDPQPTHAFRVLSPSEPLHLSPTPDETDIETLAIGLDLLGLPVTPQGEHIGRVVEALREDGLPLYRRVAVQVPRRSAKTTSTTAIVLGRMATRTGYRVLSTAQTSKIARAIWLEVVHALDAHYADVGEDARPYVVRLSNGDESLTWRSTGSTWRPVTPTPLAFRSQAADLLIFEEAGHIRAEVAADLKSGALPTQDTRPHAQAWFIGTPGKAREGLLWDALERGREGRGGIVEYAASETDDIEDEAVWWRVHPGLSSGMTDIEVIRERFEEMPRAEFAAEYLGRWPLSSSVKAVDIVAWAARGVPAVVLPDRFGVGVDCAPDGTSAAVAAGWRDGSGTPYVALLDYRPGTGWAWGVVRALTRKHGRAVAGVAIDGIGANVPVIEALTRARPVVGTVQPGFRAIQGACLTFAARLPHHQDQPDLDRAVEAAVWREVEGGRLFGRKASGADISPLVACVEALWAFDQQPERRTGRVISA